MKEYTFEFSTNITVEAENTEEALQEAWHELEKQVTGDPGLNIFSIFDENGKGV